MLAVALLVTAACGGDDDREAEGSGGTDGGGKGTSAELRAAATRTAEAESFRFEGSGQQKELTATEAMIQRVKGEFAAPDRIHLQRLALDGSLQIEVWLTGGNVWQQLPGGSNLSCGKSEAEGLSDPRVLLRTIASATNVKPGEKGFTFDLTPAAATSVFGGRQKYQDVKGDASVTEGMVTTVHVTAKTDKLELRADLVYTDIDAPGITVTPPTGCDPDAQPATTTTAAP